MDFNFNQTKTLKRKKFPPVTKSNKNYNNLLPMEDANLVPNGTISGNSIFLHSGFFDILKATGSRFLSSNTLSQKAPQKKRVVPGDYVSSNSPKDGDAGYLGVAIPNNALNGSGGFVKKESLVSRKVHTGMIGKPGEFR
jgi:hypothetical protein